MKPLSIAVVDVKRLLRDKGSIFFLFVFPMLLILLIGAQFGSGFAPTVGAVVPANDELGGELLADLMALEDIDVVEVEDADELRERVARGTIEAGIIVPDGYTESLRAGRDVAVASVVLEGGSGQSLVTPVQAAVAEQSGIIGAARLVADRTDLELSEAMDRAPLVAAAIPDVDVEVTRAGTAELAEFAELGQFDLGASQQLLLFVFLTSLSGGAGLILSRQLGVTTRMLSTPTSSGAILGGQALGRFAIAMVQGLYIVLGTLFVFGVDWGDALGAVAILSLFALVSAGAAMLLGALLKNAQQAGGLGVFAGLVIAALGGCMVPMEVMSPTLRNVAHVTPHAWALDGFATLVRDNGSVLDILGELGVLAAFAIVLLTTASWALHRAIVRTG